MTGPIRGHISNRDGLQGRPAPFMIFSRNGSERHTDVKSSINDGDPPLDLQCASNSGVRGVIGVLTGAHDRETWEREPHAHIIGNIAELPAPGSSAGFEGTPVT